MTNSELQALLVQAWETEYATAQFYGAASQCAPTATLATEWDEWHAAALDRVHVVEELLRSLDVDRGSDASARAPLVDAHDGGGFNSPSLSSAL